MPVHGENHAIYSAQGTGDAGSGTNVGAVDTEVNNTGVRHQQKQYEDEIQSRRQPPGAVLHSQGQLNMNDAILSLASGVVIEYNGRVIDRTWYYCFIENWTGANPTILHVSWLLAAAQDSTAATTDEPLSTTRMFLSGLNFETDKARVSIGVVVLHKWKTKIVWFGNKM